jgi:peptidoglycan/LPS O-acetylase OafA/YrhL
MVKNYSPEIDSLRAISVIGVIIYHAKIYFFGHLFFAGGYYGVDIFFVISGYLITSKIFNDMKNKNFSFANFYFGRARRILPALFLTLLISFIFSWFSLMPTQFVDFAKSILFASSFISNYFFYISGLEYGAVSGLLKPLLHTWSLGIEEQFYIIFPLFFFVVFKYLKSFLLSVFITIFLVSFIFAIILSNIDPILNFFLLPTRVWELLLGSIIFFIKTKNHLQVSANTSNALTFFAITLILFSFMFIYDSHPTPNLKTLIPLLGASLIIFFYKKEGLLNKIFINKFAVGIGLISYSLYLLHYPIFAFVRSLRLATGIFEFSIVAVMIFIFSILSYFYVEKPFRNSKFISNKTFLNIVSFFLVLTISTSVFVINKDGFKNRYPQTDKFSLDNQMYMREIETLKYEIGIPKFKDESKTNTLIIGDSHGRGTFNAFKLNENLFENFEFSIIDTEIECLKDIKNNFKICDKYMTNLQKKVFLESDVVILSSHYSDKDLSNIETSIENLISFNKTVIIFSNKPGFYFENYQTYVDQFFIKKKKLL